MKKEDFDKIISEINSIEGIRNSRLCFNILKEKFPSVPEITLKSIFSQEYLRKMKYTHQKHQAYADKYFDRYTAQKHNNDTILLQIAQKIDLAPSLLARMILEKHYEKKAEFEDEVSVPRGSITKLLRDTTLIEDKNLAQQIYLCVLQDDQYGPLSDTINHSLGQQYEHKLDKLLKEKQIPFQNEEQMRELGYDKTPDIKLELPIAINGFVVNWIESKALFGSEEWHEKFLTKQLSTYWNRYGPGMVIYWFDFVDSIQSAQNKQLMVCNHLPDCIVQMDPGRVPVTCNSSQ